MPDLHTERLKLRQWRADDLPAFAALNADPVVMEHMAKRLTRIESDAMAERCRERIAETGWGLWAVEVVGHVPFIGCVGLSQPRFEAHFTPCVEIGWRLASDQWGRGYATEAGSAAMNYGFDTLDLPEIVSFTAASNIRSMAVMKRLGMAHNRADDFDHPMLDLDHPIRRHVLYRRQRRITAVTPAAGTRPMSR